MVFLKNEEKLYREHLSKIMKIYYILKQHLQLIQKQIKKWSKTKKEALINNEYEKLPNLAKKKFK